MESRDDSVTNYNSSLGHFELDGTIKARKAFSAEISTVPNVTKL